MEPTTIALSDSEPAPAVKAEAHVARRPYRAPTLARAPVAEAIAGFGGSLADGFGGKYHKGRWPFNRQPPPR